MDREKVIKGLQEIVDDKWMMNHADWYVIVCENALALLKKQVPMEPKEMKIAKCHYQCAVCGSYVGTKGLTVNRFNKKYCSECGQAVKWE